MRALEAPTIKMYGNTQIKELGPIRYVPFECHIWEICVYQKCSFRCVYCSTEAQGKSKPALSKEDIVFYLDSFCKYGDDKPLLMSALADPYPPEEQQHRLTRFLISEMTRRNLHFHICTKSELILGDLDLLANNPCLDQVCFSITHISEEFAKAYEPGVSAFEARRQAVLQLAQANVPVFVNICPWIPGITDVAAIAAQFPENIAIQVGALSYLHHIEDVKKEFFGVTKSSAEKVFGKKISQEEINSAYLEEYQRIGSGKLGNIRWLALSGSGDNFSLYLPKPERKKHHHAQASASVPLQR